MARKRRCDKEPNTAYDRFYNKEAVDDDNYTWGEVVWKAARKSLLAEQRKRRAGRKTK